VADATDSARGAQKAFTVLIAAEALLDHLLCRPGAGKQLQYKSYDAKAPNGSLPG